MSEPKIPIDQAAVSAVVSAAIVNTMDDATRKTLIQNAVQYLFERSGSYGGTSRLQDAFNSAMSSVAHQLCREMLLNDEALKERLRGLFADAMLKVMTEREQVVEKLAAGIVRAMECHPERDRY